MSPAVSPAVSCRPSPPVPHAPPPSFTPLQCNYGRIVRASLEGGGIIESKELGMDLVTWGLVPGPPQDPFSLFSAADEFYEVRGMGEASGKGACLGEGWCWR